jgi:ketosteroid isomerase-like protein
LKGLFTPRRTATISAPSPSDEYRGNVSAFAVVRGAHTGEGGPIPPTGQRVEADYVYVMEFDDGPIRHMTKIWNDGVSMKQLGWL